MNRTVSKQLRAALAGLCFIGPNLLGFLAFTLIPLLASVLLAFSNWDIRFHNMFTQGNLRFVGLGNFRRLLSHPEFWRFLGNTLFLMLGIPFAVAGSLLAALLLNAEPARPRKMATTVILAGVGLVVSCAILASAGAGAGITLLAAGLLGLILSGGVLGGTTFYRTLFYLPHFTAGVATFLLWKKSMTPS